MSLADLHRRLARGEAHGPGDFTAALFLAPLSLLYGAAIGARQAACGLHLIRAARSPVPALCVGSLHAGGTGKTPCAAALATILAGMGLRPMLVGHGYGAPRPAPGPLLLTDGASAPRLDWTAVGEEAILLARLAPGIPIALARRRALALGAARAAGCDPGVLVLDGGFQDRGLRADLALVTLDASRRPGAGHLLPWGDMREPWGALRRADAVVLHHSDHARDLGAWERELERRAPGTPRWPARSSLLAPRALEGAPTAWEDLRARRIAVWTALAQPSAFLASLAREGVRPARVIAARDHAPFDERAAAALRATGCEAIVVTEKDAVKIEGRTRGLPPVHAIGARFEILAGREELERLARERLAR